MVPNEIKVSGKSSVQMILISFLSLFITAYALYGPSSDVVSVNDKNFKNEVLKHDGIVIVEFFAPWCGHCKNLVPEYENAATVLKGIVKFVAIDATESQALAQQFSIQGYPTIKVFGENKKTPNDYQGQRTADAIISESMKLVNQLVKNRKAGKSGGGKKSSKSSGSDQDTGSKKSEKSDVVELNEVNFNALVLESKDVWLVEFFAPW
jgi:protein disulfide-isomerase A6